MLSSSSAPSSRQEILAENSNLKWPSFRGADHDRYTGGGGKIGARALAAKPKLTKGQFSELLEIFDAFVRILHTQMSARQTRDIWVTTPSSLTAAVGYGGYAVGIGRQEMGQRYGFIG
jgi:hypothetical protein